MYVTAVAYIILCSKWCCTFSLLAIYQNNKQAKQFAHHIAEVPRGKIRGGAQTANLLAVWPGGSTYSTTLEADTVYLRHAHHEAIAVDFAGYMNVEWANTPGILSAIMTAVMRLGVTDWHQNLVRLGSDGTQCDGGEE